LFGLDSTLDPLTAKRVDRYRELRERRDELVGAELDEFEGLEAVIEYEVPAPGETPMQHASALVRAVLEAQVPGGRFANARERAQQEAERLLRVAEEKSISGVTK
jgi:hypothetical protein